jgi:hypothetical protein
LVPTVVPWTIESVCASRSRRLVPIGRQEPEAGHQPLGGVRRRGGALGDGERAMLVDDHQVREGAADVDADTVASAQ